VIEIQLGEGKRLLDAHAGTAQHDDQRPHAPAVAIIECAA
jgi:hypothetical protein